MVGRLFDNGYLARSVAMPDICGVLFTPTRPLTALVAPHTSPCKFTVGTKLGAENRDRRLQNVPILPFMTVSK